MFLSSRGGENCRREGVLRGTVYWSRAELQTARQLSSSSSRSIPSTSSSTSASSSTTSTPSIRTLTQTQTSSQSSATPIPQPSISSEASQQGSSSGLGTGAVVGIVLAVLVGVVILGSAFGWLYVSSLDPSCQMCRTVSTDILAQIRVTGLQEQFALAQARRRHYALPLCRRKAP